VPWGRFTKLRDEVPVMRATWFVVGQQGRHEAKAVDQTRSAAVEIEYSSVFALIRNRARCFVAQHLAFRIAMFHCCS
jgi:hypothetical protein